MKVLFVDTTTADLVVAVVEEDKVTAVVNADTQRRHSELLCVKVAQALADAGVNFADMDCYACAIGPGSFTGIRVGVSTVKGYCTAVPRPLIAVNCLEAIALSDACGAKGSAISDAGNGYYFADYRNGVASSLIPYDDARALSAGQGSAAQYLDGAVAIIRDRCNKGDFDTELKPCYIRRSQAEDNK